MLAIRNAATKTPDPVKSSKEIKRGGVKIGVHGFGTIGHLVLHVGLANTRTKIVFVYDPFLDAKQAAYLLKYDSIFEPLKAHVQAIDDNAIEVDGLRIAMIVRLLKQPFLLEEGISGDNNIKQELEEELKKVYGDNYKNLHPQKKFTIFTK
ncbi:hypothetical protein L7F22_013810 [Adiantum nelumboides]|nr:hypothetical protein [Adiantum nelumboides]